MQEKVSILSKEQLVGLMNLLKESLLSFDRCYKVVFLNDWCLYQHIREFDIPRFPGKKRFKASIGTIIDILEPYIPFKLTEENFDLFMEAVLLPQEMSPEFAHKAKLDFVVALRAIKTTGQWEQSLAVCESIRSLKEEMAASQV